MKTLSIKQYKLNEGLTYLELANRYGITKNHMCLLASKGYTITVSEDGLTAVLAPEKNIYRG